MSSFNEGSGGPQFIFRLKIGSFGLGENIVAVRSATFLLSCAERVIRRRGVRNLTPAERIRFAILIWAKFWTWIQIKSIFLLDDKCERALRISIGCICWKYLEFLPIWIRKFIWNIKLHTSIDNNFFITSHISDSTFRFTLYYLLSFLYCSSVSCWTSFGWNQAKKRVAFKRPAVLKDVT